MSKIPQTDSVEELAGFWSTHDLTEFQDELEEVKDRVFDRAGVNIVRVSLQPEEAAALHRMAKVKGVEETELVSQWVHEKLRTP